MALPTTASRSVDIAAPPEAVYDLVSDVTRTGEWSPECRSCDWVGNERGVGARFKGHNRQGIARWTTTAQVIAADRPSEFAFATMNGEEQGTVWRYRVTPSNTGGTTLTESFEAVSAPWLIAFAERYILRNRQAQLEQGIDATLARIKAIAEAG